MDDFGKRVDEKMLKAVENTRKNLSGLRTGRANPSLLDTVMVEYYGSMVPIKQLAGISVPESRLIVVHPYDKGSMQAVEKAIQKSDLGLTPKTEGGVIRLNIPALTEERRKELVKMAKKEVEDGKVSIRNIRREVMEELKKAKLPEDEQKFKEEEVEKSTSKTITEIDKLLHAKEQEILQV